MFHPSFSIWNGKLKWRYLHGPYSHSIMYGMSASDMYNYKLQSVQNSLTLCYLSASARLSYFHWLPVYYRIQFEIDTLTYKTLATS